MDDGEKRLQAAVRELRDHLIEQRDGDSVPAGVGAWNGAVRIVTDLMQAYGIPLEDPLPEQVDITPALIERLLDEAELSPGEITPGARAMLTVLRWLYVRQPESEKSDPVNIWIARAATLYDQRSEARPTDTPLAIDHSHPIEAGG
jgi:hypothetical protein